MRKALKWGSLGSGATLLATLAVICFAAPVPARAEPPRRSLELELDEVPGSTGYELRVTKILADHSKKAPVYFKLKSTQWSAKLLPGKYTLEFRSYDSRHVPGPWSQPQEFVVKLPAPELVAPAPEGKVVSDDSQTEKVAFTWKPVDDAVKYRLKIMKADGSIFQESFETETTVKVKLPVAQVYTWTVTPYMDGDLEGDSPEKPSPFEVVGAPVERARIFPVDDINTNQVEWGAAEFANKYDVTLEKQEKDGSWNKVDSKIVQGEKWILKHPLGSGRYRVNLVALGDHRRPSEAATAEFKTLYVNTRSPAAIEQVKTESTYETKSVLFGLASYFVTFVNYSGNNADSQYYSANFNGIGGTGRLGFGTWFQEDSKIGLMTTADLSGFTIRGQTSTYYSQSVQGIYRERLGVLGQLRLNFGVQYRDLPVTLSSDPLNAQSSPTYQANLSTGGPLLGITLGHGFNHKIGMQFNAQVTDSAFGFKTPNGQANIAVFSYELGLLGSMKLGPHLVGFAGYSYRDDKGAYAVVPGASAAGINSSEITGHYLNLLMEYGF